MRTRGLIRSSESEDGAVAVTVGITLFVLVGFSALAIDLGSAWQTKRDLVTDTDAAALAGARYLANASASQFAVECTALQSDVTETSTAAYADATETLDANKVDPTHAISDFDGSHCDAATQSGRVLVGAEQDAQLTFAGVLGVNQIRPESLSVAQYGDVLAAGGLRPFGACYRPGDPLGSDPHVQAWVNHVNGQPITNPPVVNYGALKGYGEAYAGNPGVDYPANGAAATYNSGAYGGYGVIHRVYFGGASDNYGCGDGPGNWGKICFDRHHPDGNICNNSGGGFKGLLLNGYDGGVDLGDGAVQGDEDCHEHVAGDQDCAALTGQFPNSSTRSELNTLIANETEFLILLYDAVSGSGANTVYSPSGFLGVVIRGYGPVNHGGKFQGGANQRYLDLEFRTYSAGGRVGWLPPGTGTGVRAFQLCSNDADPVAIGDRCDVG